MILRGAALPFYYHNPHDETELPAMKFFRGAWFAKKSRYPIDIALRK